MYDKFGLSGGFQSGRNRQVRDLLFKVLKEVGNAGSKDDRKDERGYEMALLVKRVHLMAVHGIFKGVAILCRMVPAVLFH